MTSVDEPMESTRARGEDLESHGCARHAPARHLRPRVPSVAGSGFLTVADIKCDVGATPDGKSSAVAQALLPVLYAWKASALSTGRSACATPGSRSSLADGEDKFLTLVTGWVESAERRG